MENNHVFHLEASKLTDRNNIIIGPSSLAYQVTSCDIVSQCVCGCVSLWGREEVLPEEEHLQCFNTHSL